MAGRKKPPHAKKKAAKKTKKAQPKRRPRAEIASPPSSEKPSPVEKSEDQTDSDFLVVGIGASAGGLDALAELFRNLNPGGMAFIVVQHLAPDHESILTQLLARSARMPVVTAADGMTLESNRVYVIPPNADLAVMHGVIHILTPVGGYGPRLPVDFMFRSLAEDRGRSAVGIVLSGTGTDGTLGIKAINAAGGFTFVQDPSTAKYDGMPRSALASGAADYCLSVSEIAAELERVAHRGATRPVDRRAELPQVQDQLSKLFVLIRAEFGNDLSQYKPSTIDRRIERRMTLNKIGRLEDYVKFVQQDRDELATLYNDVLITVTSFFRDRDAFEALKKDVFPQIVERTEQGQPIRVWVPACATGEEAYSIAISLVEYCEEKGIEERIQIFGTDIDEESIQAARRGTYPANIALDVSAERLNRFFVKRDDGYVVLRRIRDMLVFSKQNILKDAPFSRMSLVSCRNLLIYLQPPAQKRVLRIIHYSLNPGGYLFLGTSETVGDAPDLFSSVDRKHKIYLKKSVAAQVSAEMGFGTAAHQKPIREPALARPTLNLQALADRKVLELYGPPGVVVNEHMEILQFRGRTGPFLDPAPGSASFNLLKIARLELHTELKKAVQQAVAQQKRVTSEIVYHDDGKQHLVQLDVIPIDDPESKSRCLLVLFDSVTPPKEIPVAVTQARSSKNVPASVVQRNRELEAELAVTKEYLQTTIEERESTLEELKSANEELQSSNEELQSTNEELETSKEEMQSSNEELTTVNEELQNRMAELSQVNDDLHNVLSGVENAVIIVGMDLRIRRFTGAAERLFHLLPADIGRSVGFLDTFLGAAAEIEPRVSAVIQNLSVFDQEFLAANRRWYSLRISPYKTLDHAIRGALLRLVDIDVRKRAEEVTKDVGAYGQKFLRAINHPLLIVDRKLRVVWANEAFLSTFQLSADETVGNALPSLGIQQFEDPGLQERLNDVFSSASIFRDYKMRLRFADGDEQVMHLAGSQVPASTEAPLALLSIEPGREPRVSGAAKGGRAPE